MAVKTICDQCGAENVGRFTVDFATSAPLVIPKQPRYDGELCQSCVGEKIAVMAAILKPISVAR